MGWGADRCSECEEETRDRETGEVFAVRGMKNKSRCSRVTQRRCRVLTGRRQRKSPTGPGSPCELPNFCLLKKKKKNSDKPT